MEAVAAVIMKTTVIWDMTPYSLIHVYLRFGGTRLHLEDMKILKMKQIAPKRR